VDEAGNVTLQWNSKPNTDYALDYSTDLSNQGWEELDDGLVSMGTTSQVVIAAATVNALEASGRLYFQIRVP
jgi:hypothetical protein